MKMLKAGVCLFTFFVIIFAANSFAQDGGLKIVTIEGGVLIKIYPSTEWVEAVAGQALGQNDSIKTLEDGKAYLEFSDMSSMSLKPNTGVTVEELLLGAVARKVGVGLSLGQLKLIIQRVDTPSEFTVKTPNAICGAHGSTVYISYDGINTNAYSDDSDLDFTNTLTGETQAVGMGTPMGLGGGGFIQGSAPDMSGFIGGPIAEPYTPPGTLPEGAGDDITPPNIVDDPQASRT